MVMNVVLTHHTESYDHLQCTKKSGLIEYFTEFISVIAIIIIMSINI